jgi:hypothetical protein
MSNLVPYSSGVPSPLTAQGRALMRQARATQAEAAIAALQLKGIEAITELGMECLADLDEKRCREAGSNQVVNQLCVELELVAAKRIGRVVSNLYSGRSW